MPPGDARRKMKDTMKHRFKLFSVLIVCASALTFSVKAQGTSVPATSAPTFAPTTMSTNPPTTAPATGNTFLDQFAQFWTQPDRGLGTWTTTNGAAKTVDVYIGACFENSVNGDGIIGADYALRHNSSGNAALVVDGFARLFNSDNTLKSVGVGPGGEVVIGDLKVGIYADAVYRLDHHRAAIEPKLAVKNGVGKNAFLFAALATDYEIGSNAKQAPFTSAGFGFNY